MSIEPSICASQSICPRCLSGSNAITKQISDDHWICHDLDELKDKLCDWLDDQDNVPPISEDAEVSSAEVDGKLHFKIHDVVLTNPRDTDEQDLYVTIERIESAEG